MKTLFASTGRVLVTLVVLAVALLVGRGLWNYYTVEPWTRDAHVRADVVGSEPVLALVDTDSLRVEGYFEETKLARIQVGDPVEIHLMGQSVRLHGRVESVAAAIEDRERTGGLLANINPTFTWVRLAQRVPVRIALDEIPADVRLVAGLTATVTVRPEHGDNS